MKIAKLRLILGHIIGSILCLNVGQIQASESEACDLVGKGCLVVDEGKVIKITRMVRPSVGEILPVAQFGDSNVVSVPQVSLVKGSDHAAITIIEYSDLRCSSCNRASDQKGQVYTIDKLGWAGEL